MSGYPDTSTRVERPYYALVRKADPQFEKDRRKQPEYEFKGRTFTADPATRGAYNNNPN
jgi:hypothetical protein